MNEYSGKNQSKFLRIILWVLVISVLVLFGPSVTSTTSIANAKSKKIACKVIRVVDGDTVILKYKGKKTRTRLIGIDTPESVSPDESRNCEEGKIASNYTKKRLKKGRKVYIKLDKGHYDKYDRLLAYVYIKKEFYNYTLVKKGYARTMTIKPNVKYKKKLKKGENYAREHNCGFWGTGYYY